MLNDVAKFYEELAALPAEEQATIKDGLQPEEVIQLRDYKEKLVAESVDVLDQIKARRLELDRQNNKGGEQPPAADPPKNDPAPSAPQQQASNDYGSKLREENKDLARDAVLARLGITDPAKIEAVKQTFDRLDDGSVTQSKLEKVWNSAAAATFPEDFASAAETLKRMRENADDFNQANAGAGAGAGEGGDGRPQMSQGAKDLVSQAAKKGVEISPEAAEKIEAEGFTRVY